MDKLVYYAHAINLYNTPQEKRDIELIQSMGFNVLNPNSSEYEERYKTEGMDMFISLAKQCDGLAFRSLPDLSITGGVAKELFAAIENKLFVIELPTILSRRILSKEDSREYLKLIGNR